jgi:hypothetical protein
VDLANWTTVLTDDLFLHSLMNTSCGGEHSRGRGARALVDRLHRVRTRYRGAARARLHLVAARSRCPASSSAWPCLWLFLGVGFLRPLYGRWRLLVIAGLVSGMPLGVQIIKSGLMQLGGSSRSLAHRRAPHGGRPTGRIVLRADGADPGGGRHDHVRGRRANIGNIASLDQRQPPAVDPAARLHRQRKFEEAMVVACIIMAISLAGALVARVLGCGAGWARRRARRRGGPYRRRRRLTRSGASAGLDVVRRWSAECRRSRVATWGAVAAREPRGRVGRERLHDVLLHLPVPGHELAWLTRRHRR